jgi:hypothetical protein
MAQVLDKRTYDSRLYDVDCSILLDAAETITGVSAVVADQGGMVFGAATVNSSPITYPDGRVVPVGKVAQFQISGGAIPTGQQFLICNVRVQMSTTINPQLEATVQLRLVNNPAI